MHTIIYEIRKCTVDERLFRRKVSRSYLCNQTVAKTPEKNTGLHFLRFFRNSLVTEITASILSVTDEEKLAKNPAYLHTSHGLYSYLLIM